MDNSALSSDSPAVRRIVLASSIGTALEWFDFALYGAASALVFGPLFFPSHSDLTSTLASFATFAVAFVMRPVGGLVAAHVGDRVGRKPVLIFTISLMGAATVAVGLLPTYETIGIWAPVLLVLTRVIQGLGAGAEFAGAVTAVSEYTPSDKRGFYTSFSQASVGLSTAISTGLFAILALLPRDVLLGGAWRIPFLASVALFIVALFIRNRIDETPEFRRLKNAEDANAVKAERVPLLTAVREAPRGMIAGLLCGCGLNVFGYLTNTYMISYATKTVHLAPWIGTTAVVVGTGASFFTCPFWGSMADRVGYRTIFAAGAIGAAVWMVPLFLLIQTGTVAGVIVAVGVAYGVFQAAMLGSQSAYLSELFATRYRFSGIAAVREINVMVLGGTTPLVATALVATTGGLPWLLMVYVGATLLVTIVSLLIAKPEGIREELPVVANAGERASATDRGLATP